MSEEQKCEEVDGDVDELGEEVDGRPIDPFLDVAEENPANALSDQRVEGPSNREKQQRVEDAPANCRGVEHGVPVDGTHVTLVSLSAVLCVAERRHISRYGRSGELSPAK